MSIIDDFAAIKSKLEEIEKKPEAKPEPLLSEQKLVVNWDIITGMDPHYTPTNQSQTIGQQNLSLPPHPDQPAGAEGKVVPFEVSIVQMNLIKDIEWVEKKKYDTCCFRLITLKDDTFWRLGPVTYRNITKLTKDES